MQVKELERKIKTFHSILEIVNAMKAFAGVNFRRCEELIYSLRAFEEELLKGFHLLLYFFPALALPSVTSSQRIVVAFGSDQGFCGPYNHRIAEEVAQRVKEGDLLVVVGKKVAEFLEEFRVRPELLLRAPVSLEGIRDSLEDLFERLLNYLQRLGLIEVYLLFITIKERESLLSFERILPPSLNEIKKDSGPVEGPPERPLLYLKPEKLLKKLLEELLFIRVYRAYLEALRSEAYFRIKSMDYASENIQRKIRNLQMERHYQRQEEITTEIVEILIGSKVR